MSVCNLCGAEGMAVAEEHVVNPQFCSASLQFKRGEELPKKEKKPKQSEQPKEETGR